MNASMSQHPSKTMRRILCVFSAAVWLLLAGCGSMLVSEEPPERVYWLEPSQADVHDTLDATLRVALVPGLDSERIWLLQRDQRLNYYAGAVWPDRLGRVLSSLLERASNFHATSAQAARIEVLIERFFAIESGPDEIPDVELRARISHSAIPSVCRFATVTRPATDRLRDIVAAHQQALDELAVELRRIAVAADKGQRGC
jgi:ABC-type uncharacterized transport system auxiliary subunit